MAVLLWLALWAASIAPALAQSTYDNATPNVSITVKSSGGNATSPYQYGLMFEDLNNCGDGGVYAELVQNRAFQGNGVFPSNLSFWSAVGSSQLSLHNLSTPLSAALPTSMRVNASGSSVGFANAGYWGFPVYAGWKYSGSFWIHGSFNGNITINLQSVLEGYHNKSWAEASVSIASTADSWTQYNYTLSPPETAPDSNNTLAFTWDAPSGSCLDFNLISLFPPTYKDRKNGLRSDLMEAMSDLKPSFFRAPGGNNVEGVRSPYWWNWTETIGPLEDRRSYPGTWGYINTNGLGLLEYMLWAQDLGMEPVLAVWAGLWLDKTALSEDELKPYIQSALDEIEFLTGSPSTPWGSKRASLGYPEPFSIKFIEVGNEDSLSGGKASYGSYRFKAFYDAITPRYPNITLISSYYNVYEPSGDPGLPGAAGDFHEYALPVTMSSQFNQFDNYTSAHPLLLGEFAVVEPDGYNRSDVTWEDGAPRAGAPFWDGSVAEAIFLLGAVERNADKIIGAAYAPMFQNLNHWQWIPDLISFDADPKHTTLSTSWHVIKLLSGVRMTEILPMDGAVYDPMYYVGGRSKGRKSWVLKAAVYNATENVPFAVKFEGMEVAGRMGDLTWLTAPFNSSQPLGGNVVETHVEGIVSGEGGGFEFSLPPYSVAVLEVKTPDGYDCGGWRDHKVW
ncbi:glycoside hydrolase family 51 protein [Pseudocercospora fijiensis CIRAD86]|uniref:non-reducing end alpha-L-arabinofuranosidase n=1 Tax=Pseudocercospora fijiensis (strain CIRAD86) TaxID=383855 RepID=M3A547_PSEFD|nr:glycoside hydrolase family 51 protein [Pseudocercospora fijiensis CIRAD86]EME79726.1 glycoside hydrolase family 51 protein [Pseudocercospora fijiensis CIRAD86]